MKEKLEKALDLFKQKKYNEASVVFEELVELDSQNPNLLNNLGLCYQHLNNFEKVA